MSLVHGFSLHGDIQENQYKDILYVEFVCIDDLHKLLVNDVCSQWQFCRRDGINSDIVGCVDESCRDNDVGGPADRRRRRNSGRARATAFAQRWRRRFVDEWASHMSRLWQVLFHSFSFETGAFLKTFFFFFFFFFFFSNRRTNFFPNCPSTSQHRRSKHEGVVWKCAHDGCDKSYCDPSTLRKHVRSSHEGVTFECIERRKQRLLYHSFH
jgi:hypothetical protein